MLGWRKRNDGFEWREYVRTTILVRRKQRRDRIGEAGQAAVENLKAAGQRGAAASAEGAKAVGRGAVHLGQQSAVMGAAGAKVVGRGVLHYGREGARLGVAGANAAGDRLRVALPIAGSYLQRLGATLFYALAYAWAVLCTIAGIVGDHLGPPLAPLGRVLRQPSIRLPLLIAGGVALLGGIIRAIANGFESDTWIALLIGMGLLGALALAHAGVGAPSWLSSIAATSAAFAGRLREGLAAATGRASVQKGFAAALIAVLLAGGIYALWSESSAIPSRRSSEGASSRPGANLEGRGSALAGDILRVGSTTVRLNGVEAPLRDQTCTGPGGKQWACGEAAKQALARLLRSGRVACEISGNADGQGTGDCRVDGRDIAAELVRGGHVFASSGLFASYGGLEREARTDKVGIWEGEPVRPSEYRERKWEEAKRASPDGCPIKGSLRGGRRLYIVPWARGYEQARVSPSRGERWFCSEAEARQAGFGPAEQS